ncbi:MAG: lipid IV(A) 3-deoxy-D-manno-octulosonic acid transferase [Burkholderiales bacterium]
MSLARSAYTALVYALLPFTRARLAWRARADAGYGDQVEERFGHYAWSDVSGPLIWIHAVSVGETRAAQPLVAALASRYPDHRILITHMTPTGRRTGEALFGERVLRAYVPYDYPPAVGRFLDHFQPRLGVVMETEVWPNLIHGCASRGIPVYLANARLSERSYRGYRRVLPLAREAFGKLQAVAAQSDADAQRLLALGAPKVVVTGNLKFDVSVPAQQLELGAAWRRGFGARRVLLAASTRDGEEALLIDAFARLGTPDSLLVIVPRHPPRFPEVAALLERCGMRFERRSGGAVVSADTRVLLGDSMGEMTAYYAAADVAFIGGSLLPFGGQNLIEACAVGKPVLLGPHTYNFEEAAQQAIEAGAALRVQNAEELMRSALALMADPDALDRMGRRAQAFSRAHQGATQRVVDLLRFTACG